MTNSPKIGSPKHVLTGRGGAGNYSPAIDPMSPKLHPTETIPNYHPQNEKVRTGRGGAGNTVPPQEVHTVTPKEYLAQVNAAHHLEPSHMTLGRGGSGNHKRDSSTSRSPALKPVTSGSSKSSHSPSFMASLSPRLAALSPRLRPLSSPRMQPLDCDKL